MALSDGQQVAATALRRVVGVVDGDDQELWDRYLSGGQSLEAAAARVFGEKAAAAADLVDVAEGSSRRSLSQLRGAYVAEADRWAAAASGTGGDGDRTRNRTRGISRG